MLRLFDEHVVRPAESLDGLWDFVVEPDRRDRARLPRSYTHRIAVPSVWETMPGLEGYRGVGWLRKRFALDEAARVRLVFGGVSHTADVYVDGRHLAHHEDAYTPFEAVTGLLRPGEHTIVVQVDNRFGEHAALHKENDYYSYGGISRPVELQLIDDLYIRHLHATPRRSGQRWALSVELELVNLATSARRRDIRLRLDGQEWDIQPVVVQPMQTLDVCTELVGLEVETWSAESPRLYTLEAALLDQEVVTDDLIDRIGFRELKVRRRELLLNSQPIHLHGYNRHEDHGCSGCAFSVEAMVRDLQMISDLGGNFIRTSHYPNDMRFLDLCDEMGFYVWEESHARTVPFDQPNFRRQIAESTREMITWHYNRPSIVLWGCLNECDSVSPAGREEFERVIRLIRSLDASRPVTFASDKPFRDICLDLVDVVSWNTYTSWYGGGIDQVESALAEYLKWLHSSKSGGGRGKPLIISEFGAGAIPGYRHPSHPHWSEEYQADVLDHELAVYLNHPDVIGAAIWQFSDVRITRHWWQRRPRTMNNKGTVDEFRRPKLAYPVVKRRMQEAARRRARR